MLLLHFTVIFLRLLGYGPVKNGNEKVKSLSAEAPSLLLVTGYTKEVVQPGELEPTIGVPAALPPTKGMALLVTSWKGPKPLVPQGYPSKPVVPEQAPVIPQNKATKTVQYISQGQAPIPEHAPLIPQGKGSKPGMQPAPEMPQGNPALFPFAQQEKAPKPIAQAPQAVLPVYSQGNGTNSITLHPDVQQGKGPKLTAPVLLPLHPRTKDPKSVAPVPEIPQMKDPKPVAPEPGAAQTLAFEPTPAVSQMKGPKGANPGKNQSVDK